jgi:hypothetical protein
LFVITAMHSRSSLGPLALAVLLSVIVVLVGPPAFAQHGEDIELIPDTPAPAATSRRRAPPPPPPQDEEAEPAAPPPSNELEIRGMHCTPDVKEVEIRRPIPISCRVDYPVSGVELRYKLSGPGTKWEKIELQQADAAYTATIPCSITSQPGSIKIYLFARNEHNKVVARVGRKELPLSVRLVEHSNATPPALPGQKAPQRCYEQNECPPELVGTSACPGTHVVKAAKKGWGATCTATSECGNNLECIKGSCEEPVKCEDTKDCAEGGECIDGKCHVPDAEELKSQLGPPKHHWFGLHFGADLLMAGKASGVCGPDTMSADAKKFACFDGGNEYTGLPNAAYAGTFNGSLYFATLRALISYDYMVGRLALGARLGWAFRGAPKDFSPIHIEARVAYSLRKDPFKLSFRPYLGLAFGHAQVDASAPVTIVDCVGHDPACVAAKTKDEVNAYLSDPNQAVLRKLDAYRSGAPFFFGPTLTMLFALTNEAAIVVNLNTMFPDISFEPSVGYQMGI